MIDLREFPHRGPEYTAALALRDHILRAPLGLAFDDAEIDAEADDWHLGAIDSETGGVVACLVLSPKAPGTVQMRQVAVAKPYRGRGLGRDLALFSETFARARGIRVMTLHARAGVVSFYQRLGYEIEGAPFIEVTIPHRKMRKSLAVAAND